MSKWSAGLSKSCFCCLTATLITLCHDSMTSGGNTLEAWQCHFCDTTAIGILGLAAVRLTPPGLHPALHAACWMVCVTMSNRLLRYCACSACGHSTHSTKRELYQRKPTQQTFAVNKHVCIKGIGGNFSCRAKCLVPGWHPCVRNGDKFCVLGYPMLGRSSLGPQWQAVLSLLISKASLGKFKGMKQWTVARQKAT